MRDSQDSFYTLELISKGMKFYRTFTKPQMEGLSKSLWHISIEKKKFGGFVFSQRNIAAVLSYFSSKFAQPYFFFLALPISSGKALAREFFC